jgi:hypothetical protein
MQAMTNAVSTESDLYHAVQANHLPKALDLSFGLRERTPTPPSVQDAHNVLKEKRNLDDTGNDLMEMLKDLGGRDRSPKTRVWRGTNRVRQNSPFPHQLVVVTSEGIQNGSISEIYETEALSSVIMTGTDMELGSHHWGMEEHSRNRQGGEDSGLEPHMVIPARCRRTAPCS